MPQDPFLDALRRRRLGQTQTTFSPQSAAVALPPEAAEDPLLTTLRNRAAPSIGAAPETREEGVGFLERAKRIGVGGAAALASGAMGVAEHLGRTLEELSEGFYREAPHLRPRGRTIAERLGTAPEQIAETRRGLREAVGVSPLDEGFTWGGLGYELGETLPEFILAERAVAPFGLYQRLRRAGRVAEQTAKGAKLVKAPGAKALAQRIAGRAGADVMMGVPYSLIFEEPFEPGATRLPQIVETPLTFGALGAALEPVGTAVSRAVRMGRKAPRPTPRSARQARLAERAKASIPQLPTADEARFASLQRAYREALDFPVGAEMPEGVLINRLDYANRILNEGAQRLDPERLAEVAADRVKLREELFRRHQAAGQLKTPFDDPEIVEARVLQQRMPNTFQIDTPERRALRRTVAEQVYGTGAAKKNRQAWIVWGPSGAGKSSVMVEPIAKREGALIIDSDLAKPLLPEYGGGKYAGAVQLESAWITDELVLPRAVQAGDNIVVAATGKTLKGAEAMIQQLAEAGYEINPILLDLPREKAVQRTIARWKKTGRFVDPDVVYNQVDDRPPVTYEWFKNDPRVATYARYSNDVPRGEPPILLESGSNVPRRGGPGVVGAGAEPGGAVAAQRAGPGRVPAAARAAEGPPGPAAPRREAPTTVTPPERPPTAPQRAPRPLEAAAHRAERAVAVEQAAAAGGMRGAEAQVFTPSGRHKVRYAVVEADEVIPSHRPTGGFQRDPRYPIGVQERQYHSDPVEQAKVLQNASRFEPRFVITDDPTAVNGPPIVLPDGIVLGGNSRAMTQQLLYSEGRGEVIREFLKRQARQFGLDPAVVDRLKRPMLVRVIEDPVTPEQLPELVRRFNEVPTQSLGSAAAAVAEARRVSPETMRFIGETMDPEETVAAWLRNPARQRQLIQRLSEDGVFTPQTVNRYVTAQGQLNDEGRRFVERLFLGKAVPDADLLDVAAPALLQKVEKAVPSIVRAAEVGGEWDLRPQLLVALRASVDARAKELTLRDYLAQQSLFGGGPEIEGNAKALILWRLLEEENAKAIRQVFREYAQAAERAAPRLRGQLEMETLAAPPETPEAALARVTGQQVAALTEAGFVEPSLLEWLARGTIAVSAEGLAARSDDPAMEYALHVIALMAGGPALNHALRRAKLHPGDVLWHAMVRAGDGGKAWIFRRLGGDAKAYQTMQFVFYRWGMPDWLKRALVARETGYETATRDIMSWVRENVLRRSPEERALITQRVRSVEARREAVTEEIERLRGLLAEKNVAARQQSDAFRPGDPVTDLGLGNRLTALRAQREAETAAAWDALPNDELTRLARELVKREDALADKLVAEGFDPRIFERFRDAHLMRAYEKYMDPEALHAAFPEAAATPIRDPAHWAVERQRLPEHIRQELGEINDAAFLFAQGQAEKAYSLVTRRLYNRIARGSAEDGLPMVWRPDRAQALGKAAALGERQRFYVKLPETKALGPLSGQYVHGSVAWSLKAASDPTTTANRVLRNVWTRRYLKALGAWKALKTIWSPATQARNVMSNAVLLHLSGMDIFDPRNWAIFQRALRDYWSESGLYREALEAGVFRGSYLKEEIEALRAGATGVAGNTPIEKFAGMLGTESTVRKWGSKPGQLYQGTEHAFKFAKYHYNRTVRGMDPEAAAEDAVETIFDYTAIPPIVRLWRNSPLGAPFLTFSYKVAPRIAEAFLRNPDKVASLMLFFAAVERLGSEEEPFGAAAPELMHPWLQPTLGPGRKVPPGFPLLGRQALQVPLKTEQGQAALNLEYILPWSSLIPDVGDPTRPVLGLIPPGFRPGNPFFNIPYGGIQNLDPFTGRPIVEPAQQFDPALTKALEFAKYVGKEVVPQAAGIRYLGEAFREEQPWGTALAGQVGLKPLFFESERGMQIAEHRLDQAEREIDRDFNRALFAAERSGGELTDEEYERLWERWERRRGELEQQRERLYEAFTRAREAGY